MIFEATPPEPVNAHLEPHGVILPFEANPKDLVGARKPPLHLVPAAANILESLVLRHGADKYGEFNWREKRIKISEYIAATQRHLSSWFDGEDIDPESGQSHLAHARATLSIALDAISRDSFIDDRPPPGACAALIAKNTKKP